MERKRNILDALFETSGKTFPFGPYATEDIAERVLKGGYPEMLTRKSATRRRAWADTYIRTLLINEPLGIQPEVEHLVVFPRQ